jgi:tetratricopeptide (TPR) repeat protein
MIHLSLYNRCRWLVAACFLLIAGPSFGQPAKADSLRRLLQIEKTDTSRVRLMWQLASAINTYEPDSALALSQRALYLAQRLHYLEGTSRALGVLSNTFIKISNYPQALELNFQKLQIEEQRNRPRNYASVLINIGVIYALQEEYSNALEYYKKADSVIRLHHIDEFSYNIALNVGDAFNRLNISDSSFKYFSLSLDIAKESQNGDFIGTSMTGLGHSYAKLGRLDESLANYQAGIRYLLEANDDEVLCEASLGLARLYEKLGLSDSARKFGYQSFSIADKDGFLSQQLDASKFLGDHFKKANQIDSAFVYVTLVQQLNDSVNNKSKIRQLQIMSSNEQFRQAQLEESRRIAREERKQQLQMLLIGVFIPGLFLLTLSLRRARLHVRVIRVLGVLSLLFFFEYLTLLLHPTVAALTHHTPVFEILIFVVVASFLIPAHHRIEHWFIQKLVQHRKLTEKEEDVTEVEEPAHAPEELEASPETRVPILAMVTTEAVESILPPGIQPKSEEGDLPAEAKPQASSEES